MTAWAQCACGQPVERELPEHPHYREILLRVPAVCERCVEAAAEDDRREAEEEAERRRAELRDRRRSASGIPAKLRGLTWSTLAGAERRNAIDAAFEWALGDLSGLLLAGAVGVGKTRIAATAAWQHLELAPLRWLSAPLLFARLGSGFGSQQRDDALEFSPARRPWSSTTSTRCGPPSTRPSTSSWRSTVGSPRACRCS